MDLMSSSLKTIKKKKTTFLRRFTTEQPCTYNKISYSWCDQIVSSPKIPNDVTLASIISDVILGIYLSISVHWSASRGTNLGNLANELKFLTQSRGVYRISSRVCLVSFHFYTPCTLWPHKIKLEIFIRNIILWDTTYIKWQFFLQFKTINRKL